MLFRDIQPYLQGAFMSPSSTFFMKAKPTHHSNPITRSGMFRTTAIVTCQMLFSSNIQKRSFNILDYSPKINIFRFLHQVRHVRRPTSNDFLHLLNQSLPIHGRSKVHSEESTALDRPWPHEELIDISNS